MKIFFLIPLVSFFIAGCSSMPSILENDSTKICSPLWNPYCVEYKAVGKLDNYNEIFVGNITSHVRRGGSSFEMTALTGNASCKGTTNPPINKQDRNARVPCQGQRGYGDASCNNGKSYKINWFTVGGCASGYATGVSSDGHKLSVTFGLTDEEAMRKLNELADSVMDKPTVNEAQAEKNCLRNGIKKSEDNFKLCVLNEIN